MKCVSVTFLQPCGSNVAYHLRMLTLVAKKNKCLPQVSNAHYIAGRYGGILGRGFEWSVYEEEKKFPTSCSGQKNNT